MVELNQIKKDINNFFKNKTLEEKVNNINELREYIHNLSPFKNEPVDFVKWVKADNVIANEYNPNKVAPPEMELLEISIMNDGYTQPIVAFPHDNNIEVVDGFHRNRVGKESKIINERIKNYLPITIIRKTQEDKNNRIASTIRHNRARGKHIIDAMSEIVIELKNRNWTNRRISRELGMDEDEILRLMQITGLEELFKDEDFSKSWNISDSSEENFQEEFNYFDGKVSDEEKQMNMFRTVNTSDENRIFHTFDKWECYKAGFYNTHKEGMTKEQCELAYAKLLGNIKEFSNILEHVITEWIYSCEHYLTNNSMNRIAWLGQAALCYAKGIPSIFRGGFHLLSKQQQDEANKTAFEYLNKWLKLHGFKEVTFEEALQPERQVEIY